MVRAAALGFALLLAVTLALPGAAPAQTKDDTIVYALQSDIDTWDPPGSVLRETIRQAVAIARADQLREQVQIAAKVEHMCVGREHDMRKVGVIFRHGLGDGIDGLLCEQAQLAQHPR